MLDGGDRRMGGGMRGGSVGFNDGFEQVCYVIGHLFFLLGGTVGSQLCEKIILLPLFLIEFFQSLTCCPE